MVGSVQLRGQENGAGLFTTSLFEIWAAPPAEAWPEVTGGRCLGSTPTKVSTEWQPLSAAWNLVP